MSEKNLEVYFVNFLVFLISFFGSFGHTVAEKGLNWRWYLIESTFSVYEVLSCFFVKHQLQKEYEMKKEDRVRGKKILIKEGSKRN